MKEDLYSVLANFAAGSTIDSSSGVSDAETGDAALLRFLRY